jgi:hypothetical protein
VRHEKKSAKSIAAPHLAGTERGLGKISGHFSFYGYAGFSGIGISGNG